MGRHIPNSETHLNSSCFRLYYGPGTFVRSPPSTVFAYRKIASHLTKLDDWYETNSDDVPTQGGFFSVRYDRRLHTIGCHRDV